MRAARLQSERGVASLLRAPHRGDAFQSVQLGGFILGCFGPRSCWVMASARSQRREWYLNGQSLGRLKLLPGLWLAACYVVGRGRRSLEGAWPHCNMQDALQTKW